MASVLVATTRGCQVFIGPGESAVELPGRAVWAIAPDAGGACVAIVDGNQIWRRTPAGQWSHLSTADLALCAIASVGGKIFAGSSNDAVLLALASDNKLQRVISFDQTPGRADWFGNGPPLQVRWLTGTADGHAILAAVHVGGIPRSTDSGKTWSPTIPIKYDVHEVRSHPTTPLVAAATAVGLCVSEDTGAKWKLITDGLAITNSLAVAVLPDEVLFSIQDGPFAERSQLWRWPITGGRAEQVRQGLPQWLKGKIDTAHIAANHHQAALVDGGGDLWLSSQGSTGWLRIATGLQDALGVQLL